MLGRSSQQDAGNEIISEINVVPLVDISLVLLMIFMVTASYVVTGAFMVDMPKAMHGAEIPQDSETVMISVTREGPVYLDDKLVNTADLKTMMQHKHQANPQLGVVLSADKGAYFQDVVRILDVLSGIGIHRLNIATEKE